MLLKENLNLDEFLGLQSSDIVDISFISGGNANVKEQTIENQSQDIIAFNVANSFENEVYEVDFNHVINAVVSAMSKTANQPVKGRAFIEPCEIEEIKNSLDKEISDTKAAEAVREELTNFQNKITADYRNKVKEFNAEKIRIENEIDALMIAKSDLVNQRLQNFQWPFNDTTRSIDAKIERLKLMARKCIMKADEVLQMRPAASEKEILMFKAQLQEKLS